MWSLLEVKEVTAQSFSAILPYGLSLVLLGVRVRGERNLEKEERRVRARRTDESANVEVHNDF